MLRLLFIYLFNRGASGQSLEQAKRVACHMSIPTLRMLFLKFQSGTSKMVQQVNAVITKPVDRPKFHF